MIIQQTRQSHTADLQKWLVANFNGTKTDDYSINRYSTINFTDRSTFKPTSWIWDFGDGQTGNGMLVSHAYQSAGTFNVKLLASNGTTADSAIQSVTVNDNVGLNSSNLYRHISIFPNPTKDQVYIQTENCKFGNITIFDLSGRGIFLKTIQSNAESVDISSFAKGVYIIQVSDDAGLSVAVRKVVVQ